MMPLVSLRKHLRLALSIMLAVLVLGIAAVWNKGKPVYSVTATINVSQHFISILKDSKELEMAGSQAYKQFIEQQALTIGRLDILMEAIKRVQQQGVEWQASDETLQRAAERLRAALVVKTIKDTTMITVSMESEHLAGLEKIINTVLDVYLEKSREVESLYAMDQRTRALTERREAILGAIEKKMARRTRISEQLGVTTFTDTAISRYDQLMTDSLTALVKAQRERIISESNLAIFEGKNGREALAAAAFDSVQKDAGLNSLKANLHQRRSELFQQISGLEDRHPLTSQIKQELDHIDAELNRITTEVFDGVTKSILEQLQSDVQRNRRTESELHGQYEEIRQKAASFAALYNEGVALNDELEHDRSRLNDVDSRLEFFAVESQAPGFVRIDSYALPPEIPVKGGRKKLFIMVFAAAFGLGLGAPIGLDLLDRGIKTPGQVAKLLGHAPLAGILEASDDLAMRRVRADQLRRLAIAMDRERLAHGNPLIMMTSVKPGAGVTGLAFELGHELRELGVRCVVVETNPFKPDGRYNTDADRPGLLDLLVEPIAVTEAVTPASHDLPDRIGIGFAFDPHLFNYPTLRKRLDDLRALYDVVILDAPPVLLSGDTEYFSGISDVSLLLIGSGQTGPGELRRAADILQKANPPVVGFIVTHLKIYKGGGYFGKQVEEYALAEANAREVIKAHHLHTNQS